MVEPKDLIPGSVYYMILFYDTELQIPNIRTLVYIGKNVLAGREDPLKDEWVFQDPKSYLKDGSIINIKSKKKKRDAHRKSLVVDEGTLYSIHDLDGLLERLIKLQKSQKK